MPTIIVYNFSGKTLLYDKPICKVGGFKIFFSAKKFGMKEVGFCKFLNVGIGKILDRVRKQAKHFLLGGAVKWP